MVSRPRDATPAPGDERRRGGVLRDTAKLAKYLAYASALHVLFVAIGLLRSGRVMASEAATSPSLPEVDIAVSERNLDALLPGGGATPPEEKLADRDRFPEATPPTAELAKAAPRTRAARAIPNDDAVIAVRSTDPSDEAPIAGADHGDRTLTDTGIVADAGTDADDTATPIFPKSFDPVQAALARRQNDYSGEYGSGPGHHGGPGGFGIGAKPIPIVRGASPFGNDNGGAFKGTICYIPKETQSLYEIRSCDPVGYFYTNVFDVPQRSFTEGFPGVNDRFEYFEIEYQGTFKVQKSGSYGFRSVSDDGTLLYIDGSLVVDNDGVHGPERPVEGSAELSAGPHHLRLLYFQGHREFIALQLYVTPPGGAERLFGPSF